MRLIFMYFIGCAFLTSCSNSMNETQFRNYIQDPGNGLTHTLLHEKTHITCSYRPPDLFVSQESSNSKLLSKRSIDSLRRVYEGRTYFSLTLSHNGTEIENQFVTNQAAFAQAVTYLSSTIAQDVYLSTPAPQADSVVALMAMYPRQYGTTGCSTVLLVFDTHRLNLSHGFTLTYRDTQFQLGTLHFDFAVDDLADLPALKF